MKRKNALHPDPVDLLHNLKQRRTEHQRLEVISRARLLTSRPQRVHTVLIEDTAQQEASPTSKALNLNLNISADQRRLTKSFSSAKNKSLKNIYGKTMAVSPHSRKRMFTPRANSHNKAEYQQILDILTPLVNTQLNELMLELSGKIELVMERFRKDNFVHALFETIKQTIGVLLESAIEDCVRRVSDQEKQAGDFYRQLSQQNQSLRSKVEQLQTHNFQLSTEIKQVNQICEIQHLNSSEKWCKLKELNELVYELRISGVDVDEVYTRMRFPDLNECQSLKDFQERELRKQTI